MKFLKSAVIGVAVLGMLAFLSSVSFAEEGCCTLGKENHEAKGKLLKDAAAALQATHPDLAKGLSDCADAKVKEAQEWKTNHEAKIKLLTDSAAALQQSHPDLAKGLQEMAAAKHKTEIEKAIEEKNEKEEIGEKVEPKKEQGEAK